MTNNSVSVWVYDDAGASQISVQSALVTFKNKLSKHKISTIQTLSSQDILDGKLSDKLSNSTGIGMLIMPGGADLPYCKKLNGRGNDLIREFISRGNIYIGICAGGYYAARDIQFSGLDYEKGHEIGYEINGSRELAFFAGTAIGSIATLTNEQLYDETVASKAIVTIDYTNGQQNEMYYHGGAYFVGDADADADADAVFRVVATYSDGNNAVISGDVGQGKYLLSGVHFELCPDVYKRYAVEQASAADVVKEQLLLSAIDHNNYGILIYQEITKMIEAVCLSQSL